MEQTGDRYGVGVSEDLPGRSVRDGRYQGIWVREYRCAAPPPIRLQQQTSGGIQRL